MENKVSESRILVIEDETEISQLISIHLKREGLQVDQVYDGIEGLEKLKKNPYQLVIIDWMLPQLSGIEIIRIIRGNKKHAHLPVLMLTAKTQTQDIVQGLQEGADDYLTKPFEFPVLKARVHALLRRSSIKQEPSSIITLNNLQINIEKFEVSCCDKPIILTPSEFRLLVALAQNHGKVLTRERLIQEVQGAGVAVIDRTIDTHMVGLRKKLNQCSDLIETVRGVGYRVKPKN